MKFKYHSYITHKMSISLFKYFLWSQKIPKKFPTHKSGPPTHLIKTFHYLLVPIASISSMNTIEGECSSATRNSSRTSLGPSPRYFWISSEPHTRRKVAEVWLATAFASNVLPIKIFQNVMGVVLQNWHATKYMYNRHMMITCNTCSRRSV